MRSMWAIAIAAWALASSAAAQGPSEPRTSEAPTPIAAEPSASPEIEIELESLVVTEPEPAPSASEPDAPAVRPVRAAPLATTTRRLPAPAMDGGSMLLYTLAGELLGVGIGGLVALGLSALAGCHNGEGWIGGYTCGSGYGFATAMGALIGAPLGGAMSLARAAGARREGGNGWAALGGAAVGLAVFALLTPILAASTDQLTLSYAIGGIGGLVVATALAPIFYATSRPARGPNVAIGLLSVRAEF